MQDQSLEMIAQHAEDGVRLREEFFRLRAEAVRGAALSAALCLARGGKILLCGNGGSAADAQHLAAEFVNKFLLDRPALPALALSTDSSALTSIGNDLDFSRTFSRQVEALGRKGDLLLGISTSGNSANVLEALRAARKAEMVTVGFTGRNGGAMAALCDILVDVPHEHTPLVQEMHIAAGHLFCRLADYFLFESVAVLAPWLNADKD